MPLLRATDPAVGRAAAGLATVGVLLFTLRVDLSFRFGEGADVDHFLNAVSGGAAQEVIAVALAALVAALGVSRHYRA